MPGIVTLEELDYYRTRPESSKVYEAVPEWAKHVPALPETLVLPNHKEVRLKGLDDKKADPTFKSKKILTREKCIHLT